MRGGGDGRCAVVCGCVVPVHVCACVYVCVRVCACVRERVCVLYTYYPGVEFRLGGWQRGIFRGSDPNSAPFNLWLAISDVSKKRR